jgi:hypothetical protein
MECGGDSRRFVPDARLKCAGDKFSLVDCSVQRVSSVSGGFESRVCRQSAFVLLGFHRSAYSHERGRTS